MSLDLDNLISELNELRKEHGNLPVVLKDVWEDPPVNSVKVVEIATGWGWRKGRREYSFRKAVGILSTQRKEVPGPEEV